ncbi:MAG TPA: methyltransferase domain-containing protein [Candidatus Paceibacterota bacterium]
MRPWDVFFKEKMTKTLSEKKRVIDIGGGLRISKKKGNRFNPERMWMLPLLEKVSYLIMDPVPDYDPDIVGDIHKMPFPDNSEEAVVCLAVLEHIENPFKATEEMYRVLKPGGHCFIYVPFLYYYHAEKTYYKDYWRYTKDSLNLLFKDFSKIEMVPVRGAIGTLVRLSPLGRFKILENIAYFLDKITGKLTTNQVSGYYIFLIK